MNFENVWEKQADLPENIEQWIFEEDAEVNDVFGPYADGETFQIG